MYRSPCRPCRPSRVRAWRLRAGCGGLEREREQEGERETGTRRGRQSRGCAARGSVCAVCYQRERREREEREREEREREEREEREREFHARRVIHLPLRMSEETLSSHIPSPRVTRHLVHQHNTDQTGASHDWPAPESPLYAINRRRRKAHPARTAVTPYDAALRKQALMRFPAAQGVQTGGMCAHGSTDKSWVSKQNYSRKARLASLECSQTTRRTATP
jgi:hypothetical protein